MVIRRNGNTYSAIELCHLMMRVMTMMIMIMGISTTKGTNQASAIPDSSKRVKIKNKERSTPNINRKTIKIILKNLLFYCEYKG